MTSVLHKGYWKYKPRHFVVKQRSSEDDIPAEGARTGFERELNKCLQVSNELTALELKNLDNDRFKFTESELGRYEEIKVEREAERKRRREITEREIRL